MFSVLPNVMNGHDVGVIEIGCGAGFSQVGFGGFLAVHQLAMRRLDGDEPLHLPVMSEVNEAEPAFAQNLLNAIATNVRGQGGIGIHSWRFDAVLLEVAGSILIVRR
jgi:hypothetical protein